MGELVLGSYGLGMGGGVEGRGWWWWCGVTFSWGGWRGLGWEGNGGGEGAMDEGGGGGWEWKGTEGGRGRWMKGREREAGGVLWGGGWLGCVKNGGRLDGLFQRL